MTEKSNETSDEFPQSVIEALEHYVYRLEDPQNDEVFYVGKGVGNRAFQHARNALTDPRRTDKRARIRKIFRAHLTPRIVIHRHGLSEAEAFLVEASVIDAYSGLVNEHQGHDTRRGVMTIEEVIEAYGAEEAEITEPVMLIKIEKEWRRDLTPKQLYERTRRYWLANPKSRKPPPRYAMSVARGIIREVYEIEDWEPYPDLSKVELDASRMHRKQAVKAQRRVGFIGKPACDKAHYVGQSVRRYQRAGNQNPIKYLNC